MKRRMSRLGDMKLPLFVLVSVGISLVSLLLVTLLVSGISYALPSPIKFTGIASYLSLLISGLVSGAVISKLRDEGGVMTSAVTAAAFIALALLASLIVSGGSLTLSLLIDYACYMGVAIIGGLLGQLKPRRRHRR